MKWVMHESPDGNILESPDILLVKQDSEVGNFLESPDGNILESPDFLPVKQDSEVGNVLESPDGNILESPDVLPVKQDSEVGNILEPPDILPVKQDSKIVGNVIVGVPNKQAVIIGSPNSLAISCVYSEEFYLKQNTGEIIENSCDHEEDEQNRKILLESSDDLEFEQKHLECEEKEQKYEEEEQKSESILLEENGKFNTVLINKHKEKANNKFTSDIISLHRLTRRHAANDLIVLNTKQTLLSKLFIKYKTMEQIISRLKLYGNVHWSMTSEKLQEYIFNTHAHLGGVQGIKMLRKWRNFVWERWKWELWME